MEGLLKDSLCIAHDGSFMVEKLTQFCSAGIVIYCKDTKNYLKSAIAEISESASNYQGKLLGAVMTLLILRAASFNIVTPYPHISLHCDNQGVLSHGNTPCTVLPEKQKQADLIHLIKTLCFTSFLKPSQDSMLHKLF